MNLQRTKVSSKEKIKQLYSEFDLNDKFSIFYPKQKSSYGVNCSDERLKLYDIMVYRENESKQNKFKDLATKLRDIREHVWNGSKGNSSFGLSKLKNIEKFANDNFKTKFYELMGFSGNEINRKKDNKRSIGFYTMKAGNFGNLKDKKMRKCDLLKKQIMGEINKENNNRFNNFSRCYSFRGNSAGNPNMRRTYQIQS